MLRMRGKLEEVKDIGRAGDTAIYLNNAIEIVFLEVVAFAGRLKKRCASWGC